jgi:branched-chain amino acid transport system permease protein
MSVRQSPAVVSGGGLRDWDVTALARPASLVIGAAILAVLFAVPFLVGRFWVALATEMLILGLAGMAVNVLLGYGGSLPFGHAAFYAAGAYTTAILLTKTQIPWPIVLVLAPVVAAALGAVFGFLVARLYRFYYAMMTTALSMLVWSALRKGGTLTGGDNGITGVEVAAAIAGIDRSYWFVLVIVLISIAALWLVMDSPFGWTLRAIRENSTRTAFAGIDVVAHRHVAFIVSSFFTGVAGMLYVVYSRSTFPDYAYWVKSGDFVMISLLGGMFSFLGPMVGAVILTILHTTVTSYTLYWPLVIGVIICVAVLVAPQGVSPLLARSRLWPVGGRT